MKQYDILVGTNLVLNFTIIRETLVLDQILNSVTLLDGIII